MSLESSIKALREINKGLVHQRNYSDEYYFKIYEAQLKREDLLKQQLADSKAMFDEFNYACQIGLDAIYNELDDDVIASVNGVANAVHFMGEVLSKARKIKAKDAANDKEDA